MLIDHDRLFKELLQTFCGGSDYGSKNLVGKTGEKKGDRKGSLKEDWKES